MTRLDLRRIWRDHNTGLGVADYLTFYVLPLLIGIGLVSLNIKLTNSLIGILATALSVFCALLFGLLIPIVDQARRLQSRRSELVQQYPENDRRPPGIQERLNKLATHVQLAERLFANVCFAIVVSLSSVLLLVVGAFFELRSELARTNQVYNMLMAVVAALSYASAATFFLTMVMLLRRIYVTFVEELDG